jgi:ankyrin repeat protein
MNYRSSFAILPRYVAAVVAVACLTCHVAAAAEPSALIDAVRNGDLAGLTKLSRDKRDVNTARADGDAALHWAAHLDAMEAANILIKAGANVNARNGAGATPLWLAADNGSAAMVSRLLQAGADPKAALPSGETALMAASRAGSVAAVQLLLRRGADPNAMESWRSQTALMWAASHRHPDVVAALIEGHADIHARTKEWYELTNPSGDADGSSVMWVLQGGFTPLMFAAREGDLESTRRLLAGGADVNDAAASGASTLVIALYSWQRDVALFLLEHNADPNAAAAGYAPIHIAVLQNDLAFVKELLRRRADPNVTLERPAGVRRASGELAIRPALVGATPLWLAARLGLPDMMRTLVSGGADPSFVKEFGSPWVIQAAESNGRPAPEPGQMTILMAVLSPDIARRRAGPGAGAAASIDSQMAAEASQSALADMVRMILDWNVNVNAIDEDGDTALHRAARLRLDPVVKLLVEKGANIQAKNVFNETPLQVALQTEVSAAQLRAISKTATTMVTSTGSERIESNPTADLLRQLGAKE